MPSLSTLPRHEQPDDRGATAVLVAIVLMTLLAFGAVALDMSSLWAQRRLAQNGADAAALALAQQCAEDNCPDINSNWDLTEYFVDANNAVPDGFTIGSNKVQVYAKAKNQGILRSIIDVAADDWIRFDSRAEWTAMSEGITWPVVISQCAFQEQTGVTRGSPKATDPKITISKTGSDTCNTLSKKAGAFVDLPTGFDYLSKSTGLGCRTRTKQGGTIISYAKAAACSLNSMGDEPLIVPIYDYVTPGTNPTYHIAGFAAFEIDEFCTTNGARMSSGVCTTSNQFIKGRFVKMTTSQATQTSRSAANFGISVVRLLP